MIEATGLTKRYGDKTAVDAIDFTVRPGIVTGFLGPNGAGKSTTMRLIVGLDRADRRDGDRERQAVRRSSRRRCARSASCSTRRPCTPAAPPRTTCAPSRATHGIGRKRVDEVIALTGLESVARKRVGGFSLGMGQRLGIAAALLGDPATLILDEPVNGLDPEGVIWVRNLARHLAGEGRTVFLSSHLMSEMAQTADHIIVLGRGRVIADAPVASILAHGTGHRRAGAHPGCRAARARARRERRHRRPATTPTCSNVNGLAAAADRRARRRRSASCCTS